MFFTAKCLKAVDEGVPRLQNYLPDGEKCKTVARLSITNQTNYLQIAS